MKNALRKGGASQANHIIALYTYTKLKKKNTIFFSIFISKYLKTHFFGDVNFETMLAEISFVEAYKPKTK
jgi:hypothetical protein